MEMVGRDVDWEHAAAAHIVLTRETDRLSATLRKLVTNGLPPPDIESHDNPTALPVPQPMLA
jgi:hypothetical protein